MVTLAKLSEALFVDTIRKYAAALPDNESGWLAAARDPNVGKALALLHRHIEQPWTLAKLARGRFVPYGIRGPFYATAHCPADDVSDPITPAARGASIGRNLAQAIRNTSRCGIRVGGGI